MRFQGFILFAEMRTGSNHLEESINQAAHLTCHGEAFNPTFIGRPDQAAICGVTLAERQADPARLIGAMGAEPGLSGFRFFHDHDPRALELVLHDPGWAKVILRRDPVESYVSHLIAQATDQWRITDLEDRRCAQVTFDPEAFESYRLKRGGFLSSLRRALRLSGQVPFEIDYAEILDVEMLNGLLAYLGVADRLSGPSARLKRQNPEALRDKVTNPEVLDGVLAGTGDRGMAAPDLAPVLARLRITERQLLIALPGVPQGALPGYARAEALPADQLRPWLNRTKGHRVVTAVSHPLARARRLARDHGLAPDTLAMLEAVKYSTCGDPSARPQADLLAALAPEVLPDTVLRAADDDVPDLATHYTPEIEALARDVYNRDYRLFGYGKWRR